MSKQSEAERLAEEYNRSPEAKASKIDPRCRPIKEAYLVGFKAGREAALVELAEHYDYSWVGPEIAKYKFKGAPHDGR